MGEQKVKQKHRSCKAYHEEIVTRKIVSVHRWAPTEKWNLTSKHGAERPLTASVDVKQHESQNVHRNRTAY